MTTLAPGSLSLIALLAASALACGGKKDDTPVTADTGTATPARAEDTAAPSDEPAETAKPETHGVDATAPPEEAARDAAAGEGEAELKDAAPLKRTPAPVLGEAQKTAGKATAKSFWDAVNEGRRLGRNDKNWSEAQKWYAAALSYVPNHPTALGELGFAMLQLDELELARTYTLQALALQTKAKKRGALLYNLGQIYEKAGDTREALNSYRASYAERKNDTVKGRIDALVGSAERAPRETYAELRRVCREVKREWGCGLVKDEAGKDARTCECGKRMLGPAADGIRNAAVLKVTGMPKEGFGSVEAEHLAIEVAPNDWRNAGLLTNAWSPGMGGIYNSGEVLSLELRAVVPGKGAMLLAVTENANQDADMGYNVVTVSSATDLHVCWLEDGKGRCLSIPLGRSEEVAKIDESGETPPLDEYGPLGKKGWKLSASWTAEGALTLALAAGTLSDELSHLLGTHTLGALVGLEGVILAEL